MRPRDKKPPTNGSCQQRARGFVHFEIVFKCDKNIAEYKNYKNQIFHRIISIDPQFASRIVPIRSLSMEVVNQTLFIRRSKAISKAVADSMVRLGLFA